MAERIVRPRLTAKEAECLYCMVAYFGEEDPGCDINEWLGGAERVAAARSGAAKLRRAVNGPPQADDEEAVEARYLVWRARQGRKE
jgi:hypothetical protein